MTADAPGPLMIPIPTAARRSLMTIFAVLPFEVGIARGAFRLLISRSQFSNHVYNMFRIGTGEVFKSEWISGKEVTTELAP